MAFFEADADSTALKATQDSQGNVIASTYVKGLSASGTTITITKGNGSTSTITTQDTTYGAASTSTAGLMTSADKTKLDGIDTGANKTTVDSSLSSTSSNPVQNKAVNVAIEALKATATTSANGLMSSSDKSKLDGIDTGADVNQNAFSNVKVGTTTVAADSVTDTLTLEGSNVTITPDATNDKVTIGITKTNVTNALGYTPPTTNTTYSTGTASVSGLTKLYTGTGTNTDGTMTQSALNTALANKSDASHNHDSTYLKLTGGTVTGVTEFTDTTASTSKATGAVKLSGGLGVAGQASANQVMIGDGVTLQYDSSNKCLNFVFA